MSIEIVRYNPVYQDQIDLLLLSITGEYPEQIFSPTLTRPSEVFNLPGRDYWCALAGEALIGTVGITACTRTDFALKSMFVHKDYRGKDWGTAQMLLETAEAAAVAMGGKIMWLGTMAQFKAAQKFYVRNGYVEVSREEMPAACPMNEVDTVFFSKRLGYAF